MSTREVTQATMARVKAGFPEPQRPRAVELLRSWTASPSAEGLGSLLLERVHFAALVASRGSLRGLEDALKLASTDWRDLLVGAGFAQDEQAHLRWWPHDHGQHELVVLARKLTTSLHLSVPERQALPNGRMPLSAILTAVRQETNETGWYPRECSGPNLVGEGAVIESRGEDFVVHERHEIGVMRYSDIRRRIASTLEEAVSIYLSAVAPKASIDGVLVDRNA